MRYHLWAQSIQFTGRQMETFTVRDLREKTGELIRGAEEGRISIITKHGVPVFLAVPFDELLVQTGLPVALAMRLFEQEVVSLSQAAKLACVAEEDFLEKLAVAGIAVARYDPAEVDEELAVLGLQEKSSRYRSRKPKR